MGPRRKSRNDWAVGTRASRGATSAGSSGVERGHQPLGRPTPPGFLEKLDDLLGFLLPNFVKEGKSYLSIALGCTGGQHRSVAMAEELAGLLADRGFAPTVVHRDVAR